MSTTAVPAAAPVIAPALRRLYFVRFGFAVVWAGLLLTTAATLGPLAVALLVVYPLFDVAAAVVDARSSKATRSAPGLYANMVISSLAGIGLVFAATSGVPAVLVVWGIWAVVSGLVQLAVGVLRRGLGGQWPMIVSGAISTVAGAMFVVQGMQPGASMSGLAGYAAFGGILFLVSAIRLGRSGQQR